MSPSASPGKAHPNSRSRSRLPPGLPGHAGGLRRFYVSGNIVVVQLALQGTHLGPLRLPAGTLPPTDPLELDAPCCDVLQAGEQRGEAVGLAAPEGTIILTQLGVLGNLGAALEH